MTGAGGVLHTDRDHRLKVQMHWQRGGQSSSRRAHPGGDDNAPAGAQLGAWLRVSSAWAGEDWGQVAIPRVGQEVQIEFLHGDIDRPVVTGALYNGEGALDEQYNQKQQGGSKSTGNAPAWFAGREGEHAHNAVYSGLKTQELEASQSGAGACCFPCDCCASWGRRISMLTSKVPVRPLRIEAECRVEPDDLYVKDESSNPKNGFYEL